MNWDYIRGKKIKRKIKINKQTETEDGFIFRKIAHITST
jgi:hypothetical protein